MSRRLATPQPCRLASRFPLLLCPAFVFSLSRSPFTHTLSLSLSASSPFIYSPFAAVERLTIAVRFIFRSIARSRIDVLGSIRAIAFLIQNSRVDHSSIVYWHEAQVQTRPERSESSHPGIRDRGTQHLGEVVLISGQNQS